MESWWHATLEDEQSDLRRVDPQTGKVLETLDMPPGTGVSILKPMAAISFSAAAQAAARSGLSARRSAALKLACARRSPTMHDDAGRWQANETTSRMRSTG